MADPNAKCNPIQSPVTTHNTQPSPPPFIANNLIYTLFYNVDSCSKDTLVKIIREHFNDSDIQLAYLISADYFPQDFKPNRLCKAFTTKQRLDYVISWLQTQTGLPQIFAAEPYKLPPPDIKDLSPVTTYNTATKALQTANSLKTNVDSFTDEIKRIHDQLQLITSSMNRWECMSLPQPGTVTTPPEPGISPHLPSPEEANSSFVTDDSPSRLPSRQESPTTLPLAKETDYAPAAVDGPPSPIPQRQESPPIPTLANEGEVRPNDSPSEVYGEREVVEEGEWRRDGHSSKDRRRNRNIRKQESSNHCPSSDQGPPTNRSESPRGRGASFHKRCHLVIHNLSNTVSLDDIASHVRHLTGADPIIATPLSCRVRGRAAFRITCLYEHIEKLTGEMFGENVKVSRYDYKRDFPIGTLRKLTTPVTGTYRSTGAPSGNHGTPIPPTHANPPTAPGQGNVTELISDIRQRS